MSDSSPAFDARAFLSQLTTQPGVYRMYGADGGLLYVGKAKNLKKRVGSYFLRASGNPRIESMVDQIRRIEISITRTEDEALILEATLIKEQNPRYNISLRDDKSYPYLKFSDHAFPRISFYRGPRTGGSRYFGPFPSSQAVRETLFTLQKSFLLRPCNDHFFSHRARPCLQHQIKRCSAPCTGLTTREDYARDVHNAQRLLEGKADELVSELGTQMEQASETLEFEKAAKFRDQIAALKRVQESRAITGGARALDVVVVAPHPSSSCVTVVSVRDGLNLGHHSYFPRHPPQIEPAALLSGFLGQFYLERIAPPEVLVSDLPEDVDWLMQTFTHRAERKVEIARPARGIKLRLLEMAMQTAQQSLSTRLVEAASMDARLLELQQALELDSVPQRLECFDISHTQGEKAVASCVVFNGEGPLKSAYRKFNIEGITPGDDYAAIQQAVSRRFARIKSGEVTAPDVLFIDGGVGQVNAAIEALAELAEAESESMIDEPHATPPRAPAPAPALRDTVSQARYSNVRIVGIAKGPTRRPGLEELILPEQEQALRLPPDSPALHLIQRIRDEAHRFAITGHRGRRDKARVTSGLEAIEGLGPARRRALLKSFGGLPQLKRAGVDELAKVEGINRTLAERIHAHFH